VTLVKYGDDTVPILGRGGRARRSWRWGEASRAMSSYNTNYAALFKEIAKQDQPPSNVIT
jgi:hypothetical protein